MRDKDTIRLEQLLQEKYDSLYSGKLEEEGDTSLGASEDKEDKDDKEDTKENFGKKDDSDKDSDDSDKDSDDDSDSDDSDEESEDGDSKSKGDAGIQSKIKQLQKQYNDLLVDAFEKYAAECIENALNGVESSFGENITDILDSALQELKSKILGDLGVEDSAVAVAGGGMGMGGMGDGDMGGLGGMEIDIGDEPDVKFGSKVGGIPTMSTDDEDDTEDDDDEVEESNKIKLPKKTKQITEAVRVANFYGFV